VTLSTERALPEGELVLMACPDGYTGPFAVIEIRDSGCGMLPQVRARAFEPFYSTKFAGRGLGLAAVHGIVRGHQGAIHCTSMPGNGTTVRVFLPLAEKG
jgi:signal transduction histidine kinase